MNYFLRLLTSGAIRKTPKQVLDVVVAELVFAKTINIIEAGAGHGEITSLVLERTTGVQELNYYAFEIDEHACAYLKQTFSNIHVLPESAFNLDGAIPAHTKATLFISSVPLSFYKRAVLKTFFSTIKNRLEKNGKIIIVFSAPWLIPFLKRHLPGLKIKSFLTFPFYFVGIYNHSVK